MGVFNREELKFVISKSLKDYLLCVLPNFVERDVYNDENKPYTIYSLYFDTKDYKLAYNAYEKDEYYRYKIRLRSYYSFDNPSVKCFLEVKKKVNGISNKRRIRLSVQDALNFVEYNDLKENSQMIAEFKNYFEKVGKLVPQMYIKYDRYAFQKDNLRITFDENVICKEYNTEKEYKILDEDKCILEVKSQASIPLWLSSLLSANKIYKTSFSKYGKAILCKIIKEKKYA